MRLYDPMIRCAAAQPLDEVATSSRRWRCSSPRSASCRSCRPRSSTPARRRSSRSASRRRPGRPRSRSSIERRSRRRILRADPDVELVAHQRPRATPTSGSRPSSPPRPGRAANSAQIFVRLDDSVDLDAKSTALAEALAPVSSDGYDVTVGQQGGVSSNSLRSSSPPTTRRWWSPPRRRCVARSPASRA